LRRRQLKAGTVQWYQRHLYAWIGFLVQRRELTSDPRKDVPLVRVPAARLPSVTREDFMRLLTVATDSRSREHYARDLALLRVFYATGVRRKELAAVVLGDVDFKDRTIRIRAPKNGHERKVPFDAVTAMALLEYIATRGKEPGPLFMARNGQMSANAMRLTLSRLSARAGVAGNSHAHRRGFAARARRAGLDLGHTARILGHRTLIMAQRYADEGEDDAAIAAYKEKIG
jgi:integrase